MMNKEMIRLFLYTRKLFNIFFYGFKCVCFRTRKYLIALLSTFIDCFILHKTTFFEIYLANAPKNHQINNVFIIRKFNKLFY